MKKLKEWLILFVNFFKIGLITFGGGYAMIAVLESELIEKKKWLDHEEFTNVIAIAESTPGPIAVNSATYIGQKRGGFWGAVFATLGVVMPSFIVIFSISFFYDRFLELKWVTYAFRGIQTAVAFLILSAGIKMFKKLKKSAYNIILFSLSTVGLLLIDLFSLDFSTVYIILIGGAVGVSVLMINAYLIPKKEDAKDGETDGENKDKSKEKD